MLCKYNVKHCEYFTVTYDAESNLVIMLYEERYI